MRNHLRLPTLALVALLVVAACSGGTASARRRRGGEASAPAGESTAPSAEAAAVGVGGRGRHHPGAGRRLRPERRRQRDGDVGALRRQQGHGRPAGLRLEHGDPDKPINLSYIPHTEMVDKIARGIATGDVPDLMGMDLIYAPQFENAGQLVDITDKISSWPELATASPGHMTVATFNDRLFGVPLYADVSALFYNKDLFEQAGLDPNKPPTSLAEMTEYANKITALGNDVTGYYLPGNCAGCNIFTVGPLMWASGATIEAGKCGDEPLVGDGVKKVLQFGRDMVKAGNVPASAQAENGETFHLQFGSGKLGMMGTGNFNITLANDQMAGHEFEFGISQPAGRRAGLVRVVHRRRPRRHPERQRARRRRRRVHEVPPVGQRAGRGLRQAPQPDHPLRHGRQQVLPGRAARPGRGQGPRGRHARRTR